MSVRRKGISIGETGCRSLAAKFTTFRITTLKLIMTLLVRDEADIIASHIDFHLSRGVDHILAMDNRSEDATTDILLSYQAKGVLTYIFQPRDDYSQSVWVTQMARQAAQELKADWVINSDADEFWWPEHGNLKDTLAAVPDGIEAVRVERTNFIPRRAPRPCRSPPP